MVGLAAILALGLQPGPMFDALFAPRPRNEFGGHLIRCPAATATSFLATEWEALDSAGHAMAFSLSARADANGSGEPVLHARSGPLWFAGQDVPDWSGNTRLFRIEHGRLLAFFPDEARASGLALVGWADKCTDSIHGAMQMWVLMPPPSRPRPFIAYPAPVLGATLPHWLAAPDRPAPHAAHTR